MTRAFHAPPSIADSLAKTAGRPSGFDYLRIVLAFFIIIFHQIILTYGVFPEEVIFSSNWRPFAAIIVPMFFSLSGFLVAGSTARGFSV